MKTSYTKGHSPIAGMLPVPSNANKRQLLLPYAEIDLTYLKSLSSGDEEFEHDLLYSCLIKIDEEMVALKQAFDARLEKKVRELIQSLKSVFCIAGIQYLNKVMCSIENNYRHNLLHEGSLTLYRQATSVWAQARVRLERVVESYSAS